MTRFTEPGLLGVAVDLMASRAGRAFEMSQLADEYRADFVTVPDHPYVAGELDTWTMLTTLAARTQHVGVVSNVTSLPLRPPLMLAKTVASLQVLSEGRTILGIGAAYDHHYVAVTPPRVFVATGRNVTPTPGLVDPTTIVHPVVLRLTPSQTSYVVYTDQEKLTAPWAGTGGQGALIMVGNAEIGAVRARYLYSALWSGPKAELTDAQVKALAKTHQVICVTHLAPIASLADIPYEDVFYLTLTVQLNPVSKETLAAQQEVTLALRGYVDPIRHDQEPPVKRVHEQFIEKGGRFYVCPICFNARKLDEGEGTLGRLLNDPLLYEEATMTLAALREGDSLVIEVIDDGPGIAHHVDEARPREPALEQRHREDVVRGLLSDHRLAASRGERPQQLVEDVAVLEGAGGRPPLDAAAEGRGFEAHRAELGSRDHVGEEVARVAGCNRAVLVPARGREAPQRRPLVRAPELRQRGGRQARQRQAREHEDHNHGRDRITSRA